MRFTEEQYREIIRTYENNSGYDNKATAVIRVVDNFNDSLSYNEAFALANPVTREWAHEQYVEKEKKYVWTSKKPYYQGLYKRLYMATGGYVGYKTLEANELEVGEDEYVTETEVRKNGYDPDWFDKEEVE